MTVGLLLSLSLFADAERLQFPVQGRAFHADERRGPGDVAGETPNLDLEILALEGLPGFTQWAAHDRHGCRRSAHRVLIVEDFRRQKVDVDARHAVPGCKDDGALDDVPQL